MVSIWRKKTLKDIILNSFFCFFFVLGDLDSTAILWCCFTCGEFVKGSSSEVLYVASEHMCDDLQSSNVIGRFKKSIKVLKTAKAA